MREYCTRVPAHVVHRNNRERYMYRSLICKLMVSRQSGLGLRLLISFPSDKDVYNMPRNVYRHACTIFTVFDIVGPL